MKFRRLATTLLLLFGLFLIFHLSRSLWGIYHRTDRLTELKNEIQRLEVQKAELEEEKVFRETDEFIEQEARNRLQMVKEGEHIVVLPHQNKESTAERRGTGSPPAKPNWQKWVEFWLEL